MGCLRCNNPNLIVEGDHLKCAWCGHIQTPPKQHVKCMICGLVCNGEEAGKHKKDTKKKGKEHDRWELLY